MVHDFTCEFSKVEAGELVCSKMERYQSFKVIDSADSISAKCAAYQVGKTGMAYTAAGSSF